MANDPVVLAHQIVLFLVAHEEAMEAQGTVITGLAQAVERASYLAKILEEQRQQPLMAPWTTLEHTPEPRVRSVTVRVILEDE